jgi:hypothetical protein
MNNTKMSVVHLEPTTTNGVKVALLDELERNIKYTQTARRDFNWANNVLIFIGNARKDLTNMQAIIVPEESVKFLNSKNRFPFFTDVLVRNYVPGAKQVKSNNGVDLLVGMEVICSFEQKYGGTKNRIIRKITNSGIYFQGMNNPIPVNDTHRIFA